MACLRGGEKLLHQAFLVGLEGFELLAFGGDQGVEAAQARGDALLFGGLGRHTKRETYNILFAKVCLFYSIVEIQKV
jgi:hypothetical protein